MEILTLITQQLMEQVEKRIEKYMEYLYNKINQLDISGYIEYYTHKLKNIYSFKSTWNSASNISTSQKIEILGSMCSDRNRLKLEISKNNMSMKVSNIWN